MDHAATLYEVGLNWSEVSRALGRLQLQGGSLGNRDRREIRQALAAMEAIARRLGAAPGELGTPDALDPVAATLAEVVQPMYSRSLLVEHLGRAQALLATLLHAEPELEKVVLHPAQMAWLVEFLSACCLSLLRVIATRRLGPHALAFGS